MHADDTTTNGDSGYEASTAAASDGQGPASSCVSPDEGGMRGAEEMPKSAAFSAWDVLLPALIFAIALVIRLVYVFQLRENPLFDQPILDGEAHDKWARMILEGEPFFEGAYFKAPLYPWFLAIVYRIFGADYLVPRLVQAAMGSASCALVYLVGREAFGRAAGAIAGLASATFWVLIYFDGELLLEPLSVFLNLLAMWLILRAAKTKSGVDWLACGLVLGLSAINRPNVLVFMPFVALWIIVAGRRELRSALVRATMFGAACMLPILPITIRNYVVGDDFVLIASQAGPNFYIGNNAASNGMLASVPGARTSWFGGFQDWTTLAEQESGRRLKASEVSRFYFQKSRAFMREDPLTAFNLMFAKFQIFFYELEVTNNHDLYYFTSRYTPIVRYLPLTSGTILAFGVLGLMLSVGRLGQLFPLWIFPVLYSATVIAFFVCSRFRAPAMPFFIVFAAYVPVYFWGAALRRDWGKLIGCAILLVFLWKGVNRGIPEEHRLGEAARARCQIGKALAMKGNPEAAEREYFEALELNPKCVDAETNLAITRFMQGNLEESIERYRRVLVLNPRADVHERFAEALLMQGEWAEAIRVLREGLEVVPGYLDLKRKLAFALAVSPIAAHRNGREAVRLAEEVRAFGSGSPETYDTLGVAYAEVGRFEEAIRAGRQALDLALSSGASQAVLDIKERLKMYEQGRPFRQVGPRR